MVDGQPQRPLGLNGGIGATTREEDASPRCVTMSDRRPTRPMRSACATARSISSIPASTRPDRM